MSPKDQPLSLAQKRRVTATRPPTSRVVPSRLHFEVEATGLEGEGLERFERRFARVLATGAPVIHLHLLDDAALGSRALGTLLRARAEAARVGLKLVLDPSSRKAVKLLRELGLAPLLAVA